MILLFPGKRSAPANDSKKNDAAGKKRYFCGGGCAPSCAPTCSVGCCAATQILPPMPAMIPSLPIYPVPMPPYGCAPGYGGYGWSYGTTRTIWTTRTSWTSRIYWSIRSNGSHGSYGSARTSWISSTSSPSLPTSMFTLVDYYYCTTCSISTSYELSISVSSNCMLLSTTSSNPTSSFSL